MVFPSVQPQAHSPRNVLPANLHPRDLYRGPTGGTPALLRLMVNPGERTGSRAVTWRECGRSLPRLEGLAYRRREIVCAIVCACSLCMELIKNSFRQQEMVEPFGAAMWSQ